MIDWKPVLVALSVLGLVNASEYQVIPGAVNEALLPLRTGRITGTVLPIWNSPTLFTRMKRGLDEQGFRLFRFPNGSLANEYHWNGAGHYDSIGIWHPASDTLKPGFLSHTIYRGTTKNNYGAAFYSNLTDGVDSTLWWSDPLGGIHAWVVIDLKQSHSIDSVQIVWGAMMPDSVSMGAMATSGKHPYSTTGLDYSQKIITAVSDSITTLHIDPVDIRYLGIRPLGIGSDGVQIGEIRAWEKGVQITSNTPNHVTQSQVWAMSSHPANRRSNEWSGTGTPNWTFSMFVDYIAKIPGAEALVGVNYGTGTPEEAAAWVRYANIDHSMGIRMWQVGTENDGSWEEGGPVTAQQFAQKFLIYAKAMKAVDPSILILGPALSTYLFSTTGSADLNHTTWTEEFLRLIGEAEIADGKRYLDGFDFHAYPYRPTETPVLPAMFASIREVAPNLDTLIAMMNRHLQDPGSRLISLSEFNATVLSTHLTMVPENAMGMAMMLAQLIEKFGGQAMSIAWESYSTNGGNPDGSAGGTYGTLSLFVPPRSEAASSIDLAPNAPYWGNWMVSKVWAIDSAKPMATSVTGGNALETFALTDGIDTSYLLQNISANPCTTTVGQPFTRGWIYSFSSAQYSWNGTSADAYASPNAGPSSRPIPNAWDGRVILPAYGMVVVRTNAADPVTANHVVQMTVNRKSLEMGDTLVISGTILRPPDDSVPKAQLGDKDVALAAIDGAWDGPEEAFIAFLTAEDIGDGMRWLRLGNFDSIEISVTGKSRPTVWIDQFEDELMTSDQPSRPRWTSYVPGGAPSTMKITFPARASGGRSYLCTGFLKQPPTLGYPVFFESGLHLERELVSNSVGIKFDFASWHSAGGNFSLHIGTDTVKNSDNYLMALPSTDSVWQTVRVKWGAFQQPGWGGVLTGPLLARQILSAIFRADGEGDAKFWIDNLALLASEGDSVAPVAKEKSPRPDGSILSHGKTWVFDLPAGASVRLIGLDGRLLQRFEASHPNRYTYAPVHAGIVYAVVQIAGKQQIRMLPNLH